MLLLFSILAKIVEIRVYDKQENRGLDFHEKFIIYSGKFSRGD